MFASALSQRSTVKEIFYAKEKSEKLIKELKDPNLSGADKKKIIDDLIDIKEKLKKIVG